MSFLRCSTEISLAAAYKDRYLCWHYWWTWQAFWPKHWEVARVFGYPEYKEGYFGGWVPIVAIGINLWILSKRQTYILIEIFRSSSLSKTSLGVLIHLFFKLLYKINCKPKKTHTLFDYSLSLYFLPANIKLKVILVYFCYNNNHQQCKINLSTAYLIQKGVYLSRYYEEKKER